MYIYINRERDLARVLGVCVTYSAVVVGGQEELPGWGRRGAPVSGSRTVPG